MSNPGWEGVGQGDFRFRLSYFKIPTIKGLSDFVLPLGSNIYGFWECQDGASTLEGSPVGDRNYH